jgi:hypothetical protein
MAEKHMKNTKKTREKHVKDEGERIRGEGELPPPI